MGSGRSLPQQYAPDDDEESWDFRVDKHAAPPADVLERLVAKGAVVPCAAAGGAAMGKYHRHVSGDATGYASAAARKTWFDIELEKLKAAGSWKELEIFEECSADFAMVYGQHAFDGQGFPFFAMRPRLERMREDMEAMSLPRGN